MEDGCVYMLIDMVGFVCNLLYQFVEVFCFMLEEVGEVDVVLYVVDGFYFDFVGQLQMVCDVFGDVGVCDLLEIVVFNKVDLIDDDERLVLCGLQFKVYFVLLCFGEGIDEFWVVIEVVLLKFVVEIYVVVLYDCGDLVVVIYESGMLLFVEYWEEGMVVYVWVFECFVVDFVLFIGWD